MLTRAANFTFYKFHTVWKIGTKTSLLENVNLPMVNFDNFGGLTSVLKFHIFLVFKISYVFVSSAKGTDSIFLRYEELVPVLHIWLLLSFYFLWH